MFNSLFEELKTAITNSNSEYNLDLITNAYQLAFDAHLQQKRSTGEPYIIHPIAVAKILVDLGMDSESIAAALLHDVVEDTEISLDFITKKFGENVALLVDGVTKLNKITYSSREEAQAENLRKMLVAMSEDIRVIIIKLADRLHNMRTIDALNEQKRKIKSLETIEVFAPIAHRLGIRTLKEELEDLAIRQLDPIGYSNIVELVENYKKGKNNFLNEIQHQLQERLEKEIGPVHIEGRMKSVYGIYRKMYMQGRNFDEIYDIFAVRVIVKSVAECYNILGIVHDMFRLIPGRFKDYIATPKNNMYQSLHTTVLSRYEIPFETQIRTWEMHDTAEFGIAAHWKYKEGITKNDSALDERLSWIRQLLDGQKDANDFGEIVQTIKTDLTQDDVFVFSPKGDIIILPVGSTVIDFAYAIHSQVGHKMIGAKVDGKIVQINYAVKTGEIIEIITSQQQNKGPSRDWLNIVKTSGARSKIRGWFKKEERPENIIRGKSEFFRELKKNNISLNDEKEEKFVGFLAEKYHCNSIEDFYASIGYGGIILSNIVSRIKEHYERMFGIVKKEEPVITAQSATKPTNHDGVIIEGLDNCQIKLSRCCNPLPGDEIIGFITRGHGVSVHKCDCNNVPDDISKCEYPDRWVSAHWGSVVPSEFNSTIYIYAEDRARLLADITLILTNMDVSIHSINAREAKGSYYEITLSVSVQSVKHLNSLISKLKLINNVISVKRASN